MAEMKLYGTKKIFVDKIDSIAKENITSDDICNDFVTKKNLRGKLMKEDTKIKSEVRYIRYGNRIGIEKVLP